MGSATRTEGSYTDSDAAARESQVPNLSMNPYVRAVLRFWWVVLAGFLVASVAAVAMEYRIDFSSFPAKLEARTQPTYSASTRLLVTSAEAPYFRTSISRSFRTSSADDAVPFVSTSPPDTQTLVQAANLYPVLIQSDQVAKLRRRMFGDISGAVSANAIFAVASPNRFELSEVPVIEIFATSTTALNAVNLAQTTAEAFQRWIKLNQDSANLTQRERIVVQQIRRPTGAVASGQGGGGMPVMIIIAVLAAFVAFAIVLDRLFPRTSYDVLEDLNARLTQHA